MKRFLHKIQGCHWLGKSQGKLIFAKSQGIWFLAREIFENYQKVREDAESPPKSWNLFPVITFSIQDISECLGHSGDIWVHLEFAQISPKCLGWYSGRIVKIWGGGYPSFAEPLDNGTPLSRLVCSVLCVKSSQWAGGPDCHKALRPGGGGGRRHCHSSGELDVRQ